MEPTDLFLDKFRAAAGWGADYEMRLRLLADKTPTIAHTSTASRAEVTEEAILAHFAAELQPGEADAMRTTRRLRNKLLHGDFIEAREKLEELGHPPGQPVIRKVKLDESLAPVAQVIAAVEDGGDHLAPATHPIAGNIFGWLAESALDGSFERAVQSFKKASAIVDRLARL